MLRDVVGPTLLFVGLAGCAPSDVPLSVRWNGASWVSYTVWTKTGAVLGPNSASGLS
jgi:hypothetical protein